MSTHTLRIIGGNLRGRKLKFPALPQLRPTPDRVRETLFNWLAPVITDTHCLDLFAGSGALSFEALSRGAAQAILIDKDPRIITYLHEQSKIFNLSNAIIHQAQIPCPSLPISFPRQRFDIIFLDPPFNQNLIQPTCKWLVKQNLLSPQAYIYLETEIALDPLPIPAQWQLLHSKKTAQVQYSLAQC